MTTTSSADAQHKPAEGRRDRLERLVQISSHRYDLKLGFGQKDGIGSDQIVVGVDEEQAAAADYVWLRGSALHLLGHCLQDIRSAAAEARREEASGSPHFLSLWHALEDARLENWMVRRWPGMQRSFAARLLPNLGGRLLARMPVQVQVEYSLYLVGRGYDAGGASRDVTEAIEPIRGELLAGAWGESPAQSLRAMRAMYAALAPLLPRGKGAGGRDGAGFLDEEQDEPRAQKSGSDANRQGQGLPELELEEGVTEVSPLGRQREMPEWYRPGSAPWFERGVGEKQVHASAVRSDRQTLVEPPRQELGAYRQLWSEVQREAGYLLTRLMYLMEEQAYLRYGGHFRSGKLEMNKLYKQRLGDYRLFQRVIEGGQQQVAFSLLVDESASMSGQEKYRSAAKAAILLGEALSRIDIPFEIIGFTTAGFEAQAALRLGLTPAYKYRAMRCTPLEHRIYKSFEDPFRFVRTRLAGIQPRHNNWDEEHLVFAHHRLKGRVEPNKVMIVLSDGQPNGNADHLIGTVAWLERQGTTVIGVGVGADFVRRIYRDSIVAGDFRQLAQELMQILITRIVYGSNRLRAEGVVAKRVVRPVPA